MLKRIFMLLSIITTIHLNAMDEPMAIESDISATTDTRCYLAMLSVDIQNIIASHITFDDFEYEEEFIERTKRLEGQKSMPQEYTQHLASPRERSFPGLEKGWLVDGMLIAHCPNEAKIAVLRLLYGGSHFSPEIAVIDAQQNTLQGRYYINNIKHKYTHCAVSRHGTMVAVVYQEGTPRVIVEDTATQKIIQDCALPRYLSLVSKFTHPSIAFNKQGTHLIVHGNNQDGSQHILMPLNGTLPKNVPTKKTLKHYFFQKGLFIKNWNCKKACAIKQAVGDL